MGRLRLPLIAGIAALILTGIILLGPVLFSQWSRNHDLWLAVLLGLIVTITLSAILHHTEKSS